MLWWWGLRTRHYLELVSAVLGCSLLPIGLLGDAIAHSLTHVLDVESNSLFRPSQSESTPARSGGDKPNTHSRRPWGLLDRATNQSRQTHTRLKISGARPERQKRPTTLMQDPTSPNPM